MYRSTSVGGDIVGGGGHYSMMWLFAFLIVFFVLLLFMWKRDRHEGGLEGLLPTLLALLSGKASKLGGGNDDAVLEEERSTRRIMHDVDLQTGRVCKEIETVRVEQKDLALCAEKEKNAQLRADLSDERNKNYIGAAFGRVSQELDCIKAGLPSVVKTFSKPEFVGWLDAADGCSGGK